MVHSQIVEGFFRRDAITIDVNATVKEALLIMDQKKTNGLLVVDGMRVAGVLALQDIAAAVIPDEMKHDASLAGAMFKEGYFEEGTKNVLKQKVTDVMRTDFLTVKPGASILEIAADFLQNDLYIVPVVENGELVGVVTRTEIRRALTKSLSDTN